MVFETDKCFKATDIIDIWNDFKILFQKLLRI